MPPSMKVHVHWMNLMKTNSFKNFFDKKIMLNGFKMSSFRCRSHVKEINMPKNMFGCPLKFILGFYGIFLIFGIKK
jgi:hypothetical protein